MRVKILKKPEQKSGVFRIRFSHKIVGTYQEIGTKEVAGTLWIKIPKKDKVAKKKKFPEGLNVRKLRILARQCVNEAKKAKLIAVFVLWEDIRALNSQLTDEVIADIFTTESILADYRFEKYKTFDAAEKKKQKKEQFTCFGIVCDTKTTRSLRTTVQRSSIISEEVNACRDLANTPGGDMTPIIMEREVRKITKDLPVRVRALGKMQMQKLKMGGVLGVAKGSKEPPRFLVLEYIGKGNTQLNKPIVLVGKGVTFDSGGIDIKSSPHAVDMNMDMSGGAAVIHAVTTAARLGLTQSVVGLIPAVENMPSGESFRPGDVLKMMNGKTVEVLNTDAEGRLILADALTYAERYKPELVVDVATLTGAAMGALGTRASAVFSNTESVLKKLPALGEEVGEYVWPFPLWEEFDADIEGVVADMANMSTKVDWRYGGTIIAATFLHQFAKKFSAWVHIDMAPRMVASHDEGLSKGAVGVPVRLLVRLIEKGKEIKGK